MDEFEIELKQDFLIESAELLEAAEFAFLDLEDNREDPELINEIFRLAHNLKGSAKAVGFDQMVEITHVAESVILKIKEKTMFVNDHVVSVLLVFKDKINEMIEGLSEDLDATFEINELHGQLQNLLDNPPTENSGAQDVAETTPEPLVEEEVEVPASFSEDAWVDVESGSVAIAKEEDHLDDLGYEVEIDEAAIQSLRESGMDETAIQEMLGGSSAPVQAEEPVVEVQEKPEEQKMPEAKKTKAKSNEMEESIGVKLSRIDKMTNIIGELVILQTVISQRRFHYIEDDLTNKSISQMSKLFKEIQQLSMSLRMLPLKTTFQKMNRIVRDTSKLLGKDVKLHIRGEETEVDKTVLEKIADPLVHIVRNAVDHGLEDNDKRVAKGKESAGNLELFAYHEGSNLVIQVTDDGGGINPEVIKAKAKEKNLVSGIDHMSDQQIIELIFHPGFSTKEQVTETSGRGVGMDVVKTNIEALGGEVRLMSKLGQGSSFKIILPLTLAIIEGLVITASNEKYVLPLSQVYEIITIKADDVENYPGIGQLFTLRGEVLPLFNINKKIGKPIVEEEDHTVIIVRGLSYTFGVVVEDILNQQQIVIKKLGEDARNQAGIIGSAIMADGMPSLILDLFEFFKDDFKQSRGYQKFKNHRAQAA